ncbi:hypothetical protein [Kangiella koreensis]|uniref:Transmembrane protein n=1 Tax=Kangiella koreensis (strain DSM 16069 / JCM 12317 / KCTC 12182 / SW-125) TaxID=523791 RepID=C7R5N4_KANKD|nr:hypothetical protein [Kangiella koreensis]ACV27208.1 hypothetical protein Kkor_1796 [Kangiella koreensis DSM 16069]
MYRKVATVFFAAIPGTVLCIPAASFGVAGVEKLFGAYQYPLEGVLGIAISLLAFLGTAGLWLVSFKEHYKTALNFALISCSVLVASIVLIWTLIEKSSWFLPTSLGKDALELMVISSVFLIGLYYWVTISSSLFNKAKQAWTR